MVRQMVCFRGFGFPNSRSVRLSLRNASLKLWPPWRNRQRAHVWVGGIWVQTPAGASFYFSQILRRLHRCDTIHVRALDIITSQILKADSYDAGHREAYKRQILSRGRGAVFSFHSTDDSSVETSTTAERGEDRREREKLN